MYNNYLPLTEDMWIEWSESKISAKLRRPRSCAPEVYEMVNRLKLEDWPHDM